MTEYRAEEPREASERRPSRQVLARASDELLTQEMTRGNEAAFEVAYERYARGLLSVCRRMLGSAEEAEEALQQSLASAWWYLQRRDCVVPDQLRPWLYAVARNRCLSLLSTRRLELGEADERASSEAILDEVERRAELRAVLRDVQDLPEDQQRALVLSELVGLSHADVADMLGRRPPAIKTLVFRARSTLSDWREAREMPCAEIRQQLSVLQGGALRRKALRRHLELCSGCRSFRGEARERRSGLAALLPWLPWPLAKRLAGTLTSSTAAGGTSGGASMGVGGAAGALSQIGPSVATMSIVAVVTVGGIAGGLAFSSKSSRARARALPAVAGRSSGDGQVASAAQLVGGAGPGAGPSSRSGGFKPTRGIRSPSAGARFPRGGAAPHGGSLPVAWSLGGGSTSSSAAAGEGSGHPRSGAAGSARKPPPPSHPAPTHPPHPAPPTATYAPHPAPPPHPPHPPHPSRPPTPPDSPTASRSHLT